MGRRSKLEKLEPGKRALAEKILRDNGYGNFTQVAAQFREQGIPVSRSAIARCAAQIEAAHARVVPSATANIIVAMDPRTGETLAVQTSLSCADALRAVAERAESRSPK